MRKLREIVVVIALAVVLVACGSSSSNGKKKNDKIKIGIIQSVEHGSLDAAREGFIKKLEENGYKDKDNIEITYQNAQNDQANLKTIATKLTSESDIIFAIATQSAQSVQTVNKEKPILFTAVTDPVGAKLIEDFDKPGGNITGTSDAVDVDKQVELIKKAKPDAKTMGVIYNASEANSKVQLDQAKEAAKKIGLKTVEVNAPSTNDIKQAMESLVKKSDVIYIPTDNTIASGAALIGEVAKKNKIPVITASTEQSETGGLASYGVNYGKLGEQTAEMAIKLMKDNKKPQDIPTEKGKDFSLFINDKMAKDIGVDPNSLK